MPTSLQLLSAFALLAALVAAWLVAGRLAKAWIKYRGTRVVVCPENREMVAVSVDAGHAALTAAGGRTELRLETCTRWPEKKDCGRECLGQIESAPEACLLRNILGGWYAAKSCAFCGRPFTVLRWHDHRPALVAPGGALVDWSGFRPEQVLDVLATHKPVCWDCRIAEGFRREHPELVTERPARTASPSSSS